MWPETTDFSDWQRDGYVTDDPAEQNPEPIFGWCRIAARKIDGVIEKVTEWRFTIEPPDSITKCLDQYQAGFSRVDGQ